MIVFPFASQNCYCFATPCTVLGVQLCRGYVNNNSWLVCICVSDEIDHFVAQIVGQYLGETQAEASGDLKDLAADFSTNERTSSSIDDDLFNIIEGLIDNKLPKDKIEGLTEKCLRLENCKLSVVPKKKKKK